MSSTNRGKARNTHISDYYVTPIDCIKDFFNAWFTDLSGQKSFLEVSDNAHNLFYLDPCAGGDEKHPMSYPEFIKNNILVGNSNGQIDTMDIRESSLAEKKEDFLLANFKQEYDIVITNPPFNLAQQIIEKSLEVVQEGGYVIMLLRLNFFGSKARKQFWDKQLPVYAYIHHRRMSFTDDGKTDSIEYMHAVWQKGVFPTHTKIKII